MHDKKIQQIAYEVRRRINMNMLLAEDSRCARDCGKVACSLIELYGKHRPGTVLAASYASPPPGAPACDGTSDPCGCVHAEVKAAMTCGIPIVPNNASKVCAVINRAPCVKCAQVLLLLQRVVVVVCPFPEKGENGLSLLTACGVRVVSQRSVIHHVDNGRTLLAGKVLIGQEGNVYDI